MNYYIQILDIMDKLNEFNDKIQGFLFSDNNNILSGIGIMAFLLFIGIYGIHALNKK